MPFSEFRCSVESSSKNQRKRKSGQIPGSGQKPEKALEREGDDDTNYG